jgi:predicted Fe-Mo cluster-binding NifX family protein
MLAIPLDTKNTTTMSQLFGNATHFALLDLQTGAFRVIENEMCGNGGDSAKLIAKAGATKTLFYYMGEGVYNELQANGVEVYTSQEKCDSIDTIYFNFLNNNYTLLDATNYASLLNSGAKSCSCGS